MRILRLLVLAGVLLAPSLARAYPQFQLSTGAQRCNQCHIAPAGGTLLSGYGRDEAGDTISRGGDGSFLHGLWEPPDWLALGLDVRGAFFWMDTRAGAFNPSTHLIPMQLDLYASLHLGDFYVSGVLGPRATAHGNQQADSLTDRLGSREHYVMWRPKQQGPYVRAGRFLLPYGLRLAEHPTYVRRFGGQNVNEEPYALSGGVVKDAYEWHLTAFTKEPFRCTGQACATIGAAGYYERRIDEKTVIGTQLRAAIFDKTDYGYDQYTVGLVGKRWLEGPRLLFQAQADFGLKVIDKAEHTNKQLTGYLGASWLPTRGIMITAAGETYVEDLGVPDLERYGGLLEVQYFPWAHIELLLVGRVTTEMTLLMTQLHYYL